MKYIIKLILILVSGFIFSQPSNDDCTGAITLTTSEFCSPVTGDVLNATQSEAGCTGTADDDVWYQFTASNTTHKIQVFGSSDFDAVFELFEGDCNSLSGIACIDNSFSGDEESLDYSSFIIGQTYSIRVYDYFSGQPTTTTFEICVSSPPIVAFPGCGQNTVAAANTCDLSQMICDIDGYCGNTNVYDATTEPDGYTSETWTDLDNACSFVIDNNSFMTFIAESSNINFYVWVYDCSVGDGIQIGIYEIPTCGTGPVTEVDYVSPLSTTGINSNHTVSFGGLTPGNTYYLMFDGWAGDECGYTIGLPPNSGFSTVTKVTPNFQSICIGNSIDLVASGGNGSYTWTSTDISELNATTGNIVTLTPTSLGTKTFIVNSATSNIFCPPKDADTVVIDVVDSPAISLNDTVMCDGESITLTPSTSSTQGTFLWNDNSNGSSLTVSPTTTTTYSVTYTLTECPNPSTSDAVITVYNKPVPDFTPNETIVCGNNDLSVTNTTTDGTDYFWVTSDGDTSSSITPTFNFSSNGLKSIQLIASNPACEDSITKLDIIEVITKPTANFSLEQSDLSTNNTTVNITNNSLNVSTYNWDFGDGSTSTEGSSSISYSYPITEGDYIIKLITTNGQCQDSISQAIRIYEELLFFIPNSFTPNNNDSNNPVFRPIFTSGIIESTYELIIMDRWGKQIFNSTNLLLGWDGTLNGKKLPVGSYIWKVKFKDSKENTDFSKHGIVNLIR